VGRIEPFDYGRIEMASFDLIVSENHDEYHVSCNLHHLLNNPNSLSQGVVAGIYTIVRDHEYESTVNSGSHDQVPR
jgi:hypothetical protein